MAKRAPTRPPDSPPCHGFKPDDVDSENAVRVLPVIDVDADFTPIPARKVTNLELRDELRKRGLPTTGNKQVLSRETHSR